MLKIVFIEPNGTEHIVEATAGTSIMQAATNNLIPGISGDCGGVCACATCHGYIEAEWLSKLQPKTEAEASMLDCVLELRDESRLTCQLPMQPEIDGIVVRLPESQY